MHESTPNDLSKPNHEPKSTLDIIANTNNASLVEEESKESGQSLERSNEGPSTVTGDPTSSVIVGDETSAAGEADSMEVDDSEKQEQQNEGPMDTDKDADVVMEEAEETVDKPVGAEADATGTNDGDESGAAETKSDSTEEHGDEKNKDNGSGSATESKDDGTASEPEVEKSPEDVKINETETPADAVATIEASDSQAVTAASRSMSVDSSSVGAVEEKKVEESAALGEVVAGADIADISTTEKKDGAKTTTSADSDSKISSATKSNGNTLTKPQEKSSSDAPAAAASPPPPVMKGTLSYDADSRRHLIRGMWNYEHSTVFPPQRFELLRNLSPGEDLEKLPSNGEFHGSFSLAYFHTTSKGKQKERSKVIQETGVNIKFTRVEGKEGSYKVDGKGTNQFGIFNVNGTADASTHAGDPTFNIVLRKRYEPSAAASTEAAPVAVATKKVKSVVLHAAEADHDIGPLPPPSESFPSAVVCLRGKLEKEESSDLGITECVQRINGMWSSGLDFLVADPENDRGLCNPFEYEHKSSVTSNIFPVSGRYSGWFALKNDDGTTTRINERDVVLKFRKNDAGEHNVEGKGSNVFGKYTITGSLTADHVITIFRHFQPRKLKNSLKALGNTTAPGLVGAPVAPRKPAVPPVEPKLKIEDVQLPAEAASGSPVEPMKPPENSTYSAVSRGVLRVNEDGSHSCQGKWAVTREHFTNGQTSNFNFRLEAHFAAEAVTALKKDQDEPRLFPLNSPMYKGSFQLKKQGSRYQTVVDQQVVMKFHMNTQGSYNVYGKGVNAIGEFNLMGTMVMSGKTGGQVELYRMYPPERLTNPAAPKSTPTGAAATATSTTKLSVPVPQAAPHAIPSSGLPGPPPMGSLARRESTRLVKLPSRLEDDDPSAQLSRIMEKCAQILRFIREKDVELGAFFGEPVDPVALGIPTYYQIVKEPMDLRTVHNRMEAEEISSPEEFSRLVRLIFENAMTFNIDPSHSVHQAARSLLIQFNQKVRDVDRMLQTIRRAHGSDADKEGGKRGKEDKKRKRQIDEPPKSLKRRRLEEAQAMAASNASAVASIVAVASTTSSTSVSRSEFNMLLNHIQQLQQQIVKTYEAVAELSPGDETDNSGPVPMATESSSAYVPLSHSAPAPVPEKKKPAKRKSEVAVAEEPPPAVDESAPLTLDEQELLTETINELPPEHLGGVIQIIREAAPVGADEDEIDLEIDQLSYVTQRKLLRHVSKVRPQQSIQLLLFCL
jgi:hypothetical protein